MTKIHFSSPVLEVNSTTLILLPKEESKKLPSRGMTMVEGTLNNFPFSYPLEPDGRGSHWLKMDDKLLKGSRAQIGDNVTVDLESTSNWPEPHVPADISKGLKKDPKVYALWKEITPMARWDWIRWISSTKNPDTRKRRIEVSSSKLTKGTRRPCCFNRSMCCDSTVSHNGLLIVDL